MESEKTIRDKLWLIEYKVEYKKMGQKIRIYQIVVY